MSERYQRFTTRFGQVSSMNVLFVCVRLARNLWLCVSLSLQTNCIHCVLLPIYYGHKVDRRYDRLAVWHRSFHLSALSALLN